jgi:hypothetical protein
VLLNLRRPVLLAFAYAGLLLSHLPSALLVTVTVLPAWALARAPTPGELVRMLLGGAAGIALAALYLLPAMTLQGWISADQLWTSFYRVERWFVLTPGRWPEPYIMQIVTWFTIAYAIAAGATMLLFRRYFWPGLCLACLALIAGIVPWFWDLPELSKVQFPWRLMLVVEFALVTALASVPLATLGRPKIYLLVAAAIALVPGLVLTADDTIERVRFQLKRVALRQQDVKEYQPRGYPQAGALGYADLGLEPVKDVPLIACQPVAKVCKATPTGFGTLAIEVEGEQRTGVILRRFSFPSWRLEPEGAIVPTPDYRLVRFLVEPGRHTYRLDRGPLPVERWGWGISGTALLLLLGFSALSRNSARRETP